MILLKKNETIEKFISKARLAIPNFSKTALIRIYQKICDESLKTLYSDDESFLPHINHIKFKSISSEYKKYIEYLKTNAYLFVNEKYKVGEYSKVYSIPLNSAINLVSIENKEEEFVNINNNYYDYLALLKISNSIFCPSKNEFEIKFFTKIIGRKKITVKVRVWKNNELAEKHYKFCKQIIDSRNFKAFRDEVTNRLHSILTRFPSNMRHSLSLNGEALTSIDLKSSQPFLMLQLFNPNFGTAKGL